MTNIEGGMQQIGTPFSARNPSSIAGEIANTKARITELEGRLQSSGGGRGALAIEEQLKSAQFKLRELEADAAKAGAAIKDKLTMDLASEGMRAASTYAMGFASGAGNALAAAQTLASQIRATLSTPVAPSPATGGRPLTGGSARGPAGPTTVQVGGITVNGSGDPEKAARLVEQRLAASIRSSLSGAHHDGVT